MCDGYMVNEESGQFFILGLYFEDRLYNRLPMLAMLTDKGFVAASKDAVGKPTVILQHSPMDYRFYDLPYYIQNVYNIEHISSCDYFDWYWLQPSNCFRHVLQGKALSDIIINITPAAKMVIPSILQSEKLDIKGRTCGSTDSIFCLKSVFMDFWGYYDYLDNLLSTNPENLLITGSDGTNEIDEPIMINDKLYFTIKTWFNNTPKYIDIRLIEELPEELINLINQRNSQILRERSERQTRASAYSDSSKDWILLTDRIDKWSFSVHT